MDAIIFLPCSIFQMSVKYYVVIVIHGFHSSGEHFGLMVFCSPYLINSRNIKSDQPALSFNAIKYTVCLLQMNSAKGHFGNLASD